MGVVVDVLGAVAVVAVAFRAVPEFHIRVVGVGDAAHGTLVEVALALLDLLLRLLEVDGLGAGAVADLLPLPAEQSQQVVPEEEEVVQQGDDGQDGLKPVAGNQRKSDVVGKQSGVHIGQPLHL